MLARKQKTYALLDADDDDEDNDVKGHVDHRPSTAVAETRKVDTHKRRFRKKLESQEDEDDEARFLLPN